MPLLTWLFPEIQQIILQPTQISDYWSDVKLRANIAVYFFEDFPGILFDIAVWNYTLPVITVYLYLINDSCMNYFWKMSCY